MNSMEGIIVPLNSKGHGKTVSGPSMNKSMKVEPAGQAGI